MLHLGTRLFTRLRSQAGQGTVEYVGLILLVALLMVGMVAAMKGFHTGRGLPSASRYESIVACPPTSSQLSGCARLSR